MIIKLNLKSKNIKSLKYFLFLIQEFHKTYDSQSLKFITIKKVKKVLFSVLKSPHVNKRAQEQFEYKIFTCRIAIYTQNYLKVLLLIKTLHENFFSDILIKVSFVLVNKNLSPKFQFKKIDSNYLKFADIYGENLLKNEMF